MQVEFSAKEIGRTDQDEAVLILQETHGNSEILLKLSELQTAAAIFLLDNTEPTIPVNYVSLMNILTTFSAEPVSVTLEKGPNSNIVTQLLCEANNLPYIFTLPAVEGVLLAMHVGAPILVAKRHINDFSSTQKNITSDDQVSIQVNSSKHVH